MSQKFGTIPIRLNGQDVDAGWWEILRLAGVNLENFMGSGFIPETHFSLTNGQATPLAITGLVFDHTVNTSAKIDVEINQKTATNELVTTGEIYVVYRALTATWDIVPLFDFDESGITLSITTAGQVKYTLGTLSGSGYVGSFKFKSATFGV